MHYVVRKAKWRLSHAMFVLLSSAASPRYRHDVLRCISAPVGATVQFRYLHRYASDEALRLFKIAADTGSSPGSSLICFADNTVEDRILPLVPVRRADIQSVAFHGSTLSLSLRVGDFGHCGDRLAAELSK
jgi:hypothetical protein